MQELRRARRRTMIINRPLQSRIILGVSWPAAVALMICAILLGVFCHRLVDEALAAEAELPSVVPLFLTVISFLVVAGMFVFFNAVKFSNRVAGPIYRLNKTLEAVQHGDLQARATLRDGDLLFDLQEGLNGFLDWLEDHPPGEPEAEEAEAELVGLSVEDVPAPLVAEPVVDLSRNGAERG